METQKEDSELAPAAVFLPGGCFGCLLQKIILIQIK